MSKSRNNNESKIMYCLYILRTLNNSLYIGVSSDVKKRIDRHKSGSGAEFTKRNGVKELLYTEYYPTLLEARRREKQIKGWIRVK